MQQIQAFTVDEDETHIHQKYAYYNKTHRSLKHWQWLGETGDQEGVDEPLENLQYSSKNSKDPKKEFRRKRWSHWVLILTFNSCSNLLCFTWLVHVTWLKNITL